ncbi:MAG: hypothetical protein EOO68_12820 [Moraxellaceae bacterium]|nr:MAG: hypothetical protein EOO68_12820 [Moraxellaceae bacterium]
MANFIKVFAFSTLILTSYSIQAAEDTIYTWTDEQEALTNYGGIPPDEELSSDSVKVLNLQQGVATKLQLDARHPLPPTGNNTAIPPSASSGPARMIGSSTPVPPPSNSAIAEAAKPAVQQGMLASGKVNSFIDSEEAKKLNDQEAKLEEDAKSARRIAMDKRKEEMKSLAERVRNGAASRQEIAALMTYRQTASFAEARSAMARPKTAKKVVLE